MAGKKVITITVEEGRFNVDLQGFINKAEGLAVMTLATRSVMGELLEEVAAREKETQKEAVSALGSCSCPACEAKQAMGLLQ